MTNADGQEISYRYDNVGNLTTVVDPRKNATADPDDVTTGYSYDRNHRAIAVTDAAGHTTSTTVDLDGLVTGATDAEGNTTLISNDDRGLVAEVKVPHSADSSADAHVADAANAIEAAMPGRVVGVNTQAQMANGLSREIDVDLGNLIIQVEGGNARGLTGQMATTASTTGRTVIGYAPDIPNGAWENAARQGIPIARTAGRTARDGEGVRMKGAFLISEDQNLFYEARAALLQMGAESTDSLEVVQVRDEAGRLFTIFGRVPAEYEWEFRDGPFGLGSGTGIPDMATVTACAIECRWEDLFASVVAFVASRLCHPCWVLDGNGVVWAADSLDLERLQL